MPFSSNILRQTAHVFLLILCSFLFTSIPGFHSIVHAGVVINELYPKPTDEQSEWIELYNSGSESVSLNLWKVENTEGEKKSFIINASAIIQPKSFLLLPKSQTGITMRNDGDTVRLIDQNNATVDTQSFQGILGYNNSVGRTVDGAGVWSTCTSATPEGKNICPEPSPTPSPLVSFTPTATATPIPTVEPVVIPQDTPTPIIEVITVTRIPTPTPTSPDVITFAIQKTIGIQILIVALSWMLIAAYAIWNTAKKKRSKKVTQQT